MKSIKSLSLLLAATLVIPFSARADEDPIASAAIQDLCASGSAEGSYSATVDKLGQLAIYIVCTGAGNIVATMRDSLNGKPESGGGIASNQITLVYNAVDDDTLSFVSFHGTPDDVNSMASTGTDGRLQVSLSALKQGELKGTLRFLRLLQPVKVQAKRQKAFPALLPTSPGPAGAAKSYVGIFKTDPKNRPQLVPDLISLDVIGGVQRATLNFSDPLMDTAYALYNGLKASEAGSVFYVTSGVDEGLSGRTTAQHIRGQVISANEIEFYFLSTQFGMLGPFRAKRTP